MLPAVFRDNFFDDLIGFSFPDFGQDVSRKLYGARRGRIMKTDLHERENEYEMSIDLPGFKKDEIALSLDRGVLTISASKHNESEKKDSRGNIVHQERYSGSMARSFFIGEDVKEEDVKAKFEDGVLSIVYPKVDLAKKALPEHKQIAIE